MTTQVPVEGKTSVAPETYDDLPIPILGKTYPTYMYTDCLVRFPTLLLALFLFVPLVLTVMSLNFDATIDTSPGTFTIADHSTAKNLWTARNGMQKWQDTMDETVAVQRTDRSTSEQSTVYTRFFVAFELDPIKARLYIAHGGWLGGVSNLSISDVKELMNLFNSDGLEYMRTVEQSVQAVDEYNNYCWSARFRGDVSDTQSFLFPSCTPPSSALTFFYPGNLVNSSINGVYWEHDLSGILQRPLERTRNLFFQSANYRWFVDQAATKEHQYVTMARSQFALGIPLVGPRNRNRAANIDAFIARVINYLSNLPEHPYISVSFGGDRIEQALAAEAADGDTTRVFLCLLILFPVMYYYFHSIVLSILCVVQLGITYPAGFFIYMSNTDGTIKLSLLTALSYLVTLVMAVNGMMIFFDTFRQSGFMTTTGRRNLLTVGQRMAYTFRRAGLGISVASLITVVCFVVNLSSKVPAVRIFAGMASVFVLINWFMLLTFFPAAVLFHHFHISRRRRNLQKQKEVLIQRGLRIRDATFVKFNNEVELMNTKQQAPTFDILQASAAAHEERRKKFFDQPEAGLQGMMKTLGLTNRNAALEFSEAESFKRAKRKPVAGQRYKFEDDDHPQSSDNNNNNGEEEEMKDKNQKQQQQQQQQQQQEQSTPSSTSSATNQKYEDAKHNARLNVFAAALKRKRDLEDDPNVLFPQSVVLGEHDDDQEFLNLFADKPDAPTDGAGRTQRQAKIVEYGLARDPLRCDYNNTFEIRGINCDEMLAFDDTQLRNRLIEMGHSDFADFTYEETAEVAPLIGIYPPVGQRSSGYDRPSSSSSNHNNNSNNVLYDKDRLHTLVGVALPLLYGKGRTLMALHLDQLRVHQKKKTRASHGVRTGEESVEGGEEGKKEEKRKQQKQQHQDDDVAGGGEESSENNQQHQRADGQNEKKMKQDNIMSRRSAPSADEVKRRRKQQRRTSEEIVEEELENENERHDGGEDDTAAAAAAAHAARAADADQFSDRDDSDADDATGEQQQQQQQPQRMMNRTTQRNSTGSPGSKYRTDDAGVDKNAQEDEQPNNNGHAAGAGGTATTAVGFMRKEQQGGASSGNPVQSMLGRVQDWWRDRTQIERDGCCGYFGKRLNETPAERQRRILAKTIKHEGYTVLERFFFNEFTDVLNTGRYVLFLLLLALLIFSAVYVSDITFANKPPQFLGFRPTERYDKLKSGFGEGGNCDYCSAYFQPTRTFPVPSPEAVTACAATTVKDVDYYFLNVDQCGECGTANTCLDCQGDASGPHIFDTCQQCINPAVFDTNLKDKCATCLPTLSMECSYCHVSQSSPVNLAGASCTTRCDSSNCAHGTCNPFTGECDCDNNKKDGYWKSDISQFPVQCSLCRDGWFGAQCLTECAASEGQCTCDVSAATVAATGGAKCVGCPWGFGGKACLQRVPDKCDVDSGSVPNSATLTCDCSPGYGGGTTLTCRGFANCSGHGIRYSDAAKVHASLLGKCKCFGQFRGSDCSLCRCYNGGVCDQHTGKCICASGWGGPSCQECATTCKSRGFCAEPYNMSQYTWEQCRAIFCTDTELATGPPFAAASDCKTCDDLSQDTTLCAFTPPSTCGPIVAGSADCVYSGNNGCRLNHQPIQEINHDCHCRGYWHGTSCSQCNTTTANNARGVHCREHDGELIGCDENPPKFGSFVTVDECGTCGGTALTTGRCRGCDGIIGSDKVVDTCGVCGGYDECLVGTSGEAGATVVKPQSKIFISFGLKQVEVDEQSVVLDTRFNFADDRAQRRLQWICNELESETRIIKVSQTRCFVKDWSQWLNANGLPFPYLGTDVHQKVFQFAKEGGRFGEVGFNTFEESSPNLRVTWIVIHVRPVKLFDDDDQEYLELMYELWMDVQGTLNQAATTVLGEALVSSSAFVSLFSLRAAKLGTIYTTVLGCALFGCMVIIVTCSPTLSIIAIVVMVANVLFVLAMFRATGWEIGPIEQVGIALLMGVVSERVIHVSESYLEHLHKAHSHWFAQEATRLQSVRGSLQRVGVSLLTSTLTIIVGTCIAFSAQLYVIRRIAVIVIIILACQLLFVLVFLPVCFLLIAPVTHQRTWKLMIIAIGPAAIFFLVSFLPAAASGKIALI